MRLLDSLLPELISRGHKVLIYLLQFTPTLDLLGHYLSLRSWKYARIDGSVAQSDRQAQILALQQTLLRQEGDGHLYPLDKSWWPRHQPSCGGYGNPVRQRLESPTGLAS